MNNTSTSTEASDTNLGRQALGGFGYGIVLSIGVLVIFATITCVSFMCKRDPTTINRISTTSSNGSIIVNIQENGLDEDILSSYPQFTYSQLMPDKSESNVSGCSICLADYKDTDLLRLLPDCGHIFHLKCIDPWLILHSTCPICRNSPVLTPFAPAAPIIVLNNNSIR
ncbi:hypothetical protein RD792_013518 [Penstemon davidsonii]|uniref:RING-type domain-containing protein n=1 Tax=Penstemon davidsonii TaxID=160366 RepID=A0ABR0CUN8_9LAMI|nr:hypothetical protein RD792_013518 [Penstemon davidsonii]